jgi:MoxR-like ATPase
MTDILKKPAEDTYENEIAALIADEKYDVPDGWQMSPRSVLTFITGGTAKGTPITPKYVGYKRLVEIAVATLLTDRSLLLIGEPGTAKSWLSENLAAAICGTSKLVIQGTAGTSEEHIRYSWNYAMLLADGPSEKALIKSPMLCGMEEGKLVRFEEITRCASEVSDAMISILSEKNISIPELGSQSYAKRGFSVIATANTRDRGVNDMSAALKRRFNIVVLPTPADLETEVKIVKKRVAEIASNYKIQSAVPGDKAIAKIVTVFRELRSGLTIDGKQKIKPAANTLSTAEAISLLTGAMALSSGFGDGNVTDRDLAAGLLGAAVKNEAKDTAVFAEYLENIMKKRGEDWRALWNHCSELIN